jgi:hypothetical protein
MTHDTPWFCPLRWDDVHLPKTCPELSSDEEDYRPEDSRGGAANGLDSVEWAPMEADSLDVSFHCQSRGRGFKSPRARQSINALGGGGTLSPPSTCPELALFPAGDGSPEVTSPAGGVKDARGRRTHLARGSIPLSTLPLTSAGASGPTAAPSARFLTVSLLAAQDGAGSLGDRGVDARLRPGEAAGFDYRKNPMEDEAYRFVEANQTTIDAL